MSKRPDLETSDFEPPVQCIDRFDVIGQRVDGGVDLVVVCSGPLDESAATLQALDLKIRGYIETSTHSHFSRTYPAALTGPVRIFVSCKYAVSSGALGLINSLARVAEARGIELRLVESMA
jgi:hypothetical protein